MSTTAATLTPRHFLDLRDFSPEVIRQIIDLSAKVKALQNGRRQPLHPDRPLEGRSLGLILAQPSTRTRVSFEVGMGQLGGSVSVLSPGDMQLGRGETVADTARVLSRFLDVIVLRTGNDANLRELAKWSSVPVINGLTPVSHPIQILAGVLTFEEHRGPIRGKTLAWIGDGNNVATSLMEGAALLGFNVRLATPEGFAPNPDAVAWARAHGATIEIFRDPAEAVAGADAVLTDTWVSMGDKDREKRLKVFQPYQVDGALMAKAAPDALFLHCLPAHIGEEVTSEVFEGPASVVFDEAENRLHTQKGLLLWALGKKTADGYTPFLDTNRPEVPNMVVSGGVMPFYLERSPVRGRLVRLGPLADAILSRHDNPDAVSRLGGEALALVAAMVSALKFKGAFSLQVKGDGPVSMLVADATDSGDLRFFARLREDADRDALPGTAKELLGDGYMAFTIDQGPDMDRHQGIVDLTGTTLADMAMNYFQTSEQHDCWIRLFCAKSPDGWKAGALVLERIAAEGGIETTEQDEDAWETACALADTVTEQEVLDPDLSNERLIHRLFGTLDVRLGTPRALAYGCRCNRARLASVLETFPDDDLDHMVENGAITMNCEFCNVGFRFTRDELGARSA